MKRALTIINKGKGYIIFFTGFIAPYSHIVFNNTKVSGLFGFSRMSSFLFAIGFPLMCVALSFIIKNSIQYLPEGIKNQYKLFYKLTAGTGFYFILWAVNPFVTTDFHPVVYYGAMIVISLILVKSMQYYKTYTDRLKKLISGLIDEIVINIPKKVNIKDLDVYEEEVTWKTLKKVSDEF